MNYIDSYFNKHTQSHFLTMYTFHDMVTNYTQGSTFIFTVLLNDELPLPIVLHVL